MFEIPMSLERLERLKKAETTLYFHFEEMFRQGTFTKIEQDLIRGLLDQGHWQMKERFSWFEYDLLVAHYEVAQLEDILQKWDQIPPAEHLGTSRAEVKSRLEYLRKEIQEKDDAVESAKKEGCFWSIVPLLEFFDLPEEERAGKSCYPLLPFFMQEAYMEMQTPKNPKQGFIARWINSVRRFRLGGSPTGGEVEIEFHEPRDSDSK